MATTLSDDLVRRYSRRIFSFACSRIADIQEAEDLSQEILLSLADAFRTTRDIADMDAYVSTICHYTWSKYLRRHKRDWRNTSINEMPDVSGDDSVEDSVILDDQIRRLQQEISYLSRQHRQITIMFYFENKSCEEMAERLGLSDTAVRWHLSQARKKLREGIELEQNGLSHTPRRLMVGLCGDVGPRGQVGLDTGDLLAQNIVIACYGEALTVEEIARRLGVAAAYLEYHIKNLLYMDYLRVVNKTRYQTNFFIREPKYHVARAKYHLEHIGPIAERIYGFLNDRYSEIEDIGFTGCDLDKDFVLWSLIALTTNRGYFGALYEISSRLGISKPKRRDGSEHWVCATLYDDDYYKSPDIDPEVLDFLKKSEGNGVKTCYTSLGVKSFQLDGYATIKGGLHFRKFDEPELNDLHRIWQLTQSGQAPNEHDKLAISRIVDLGYVNVQNEKPKVMVPFFSAEQFEQFCSITSELERELVEDTFPSYIANYAEIIDEHIPRFVSEDERSFVKHDIGPQYAVVYWLSDHCCLRYPTDEEARRLCTVAWCS